MLMAMLAGEDVPEREVLSGRLVVRESCGCMSPAIVQAAAGQGVVRQTDSKPDIRESFKTLLTERRKRILAEMRQVVGSAAEVSKWAEQVIDAFGDELDGAKQGIFLSVLKEVLSRAG